MTDSNVFIEKVKKYKHLEPVAKAAIDAAKAINGPVLMMIDGYKTDNEALILKDLLWYARDNGVEVIMVPDERKLKKD